MAQNIHCNGGPWHGQTVAIPDGYDHFHITEPVEDVIRQALRMGAIDEPGTHLLPIRQGTYSAVSGRPGEYEWDGWDR